jgi:hypothetical protein
VEGADVTRIRLVKVTDGAESVHKQLADSAQARIQALNLSGISADKVVVRKLPSDRDSFAQRGRLPKPCILISTIGTEQVTTPIQQRDDVVYPLLISILAVDDQDLVSNHDKYLLWRQTIRRAFTNVPLANINATDVAHYNCTVTPGSIVAPREFWKNIWHSGMIVRAICREPRGS